MIIFCLIILLSLTVIFVIFVLFVFAWMFINIIRDYRSEKPEIHINKKIVKLPKSCNAKSIIRKKMINSQGICPFCKTKCEFINKRKDWYGKKDEDLKPIKIFKIWEKDHFYERLFFRCDECDAEWMSICYPIDLIDYDKLHF